jgi:hypothetical protein
MVMSLDSVLNYHHFLCEVHVYKDGFINSYLVHVGVCPSRQEQMIENAAVLIRVLKRAHASRFKKYQEKLERKGREMMILSITWLPDFLHFSISLTKSFQAF